MTSSNNVVDVSPDVLAVVARQGVPGKVVAQLMDHANVGTTLNMYTQVRDRSLSDDVKKN